MAHSHVSWMSPQGSFKLRAAILVQHEGKALLCQVDDKPGWFVPGGKVRLGEATTDAALREFREESGIEVELGELFLVSEGVHTQMGVNHQEICFYYHGTWPAGLSTDLAEAPIAAGHEFAWVALDALEASNFKPEETIEAIQAAAASDTTSTRHVTYRRVLR